MKTRLILLMLLMPSIVFGQKSVNRSRKTKTKVEWSEIQKTKRNLTLSDVIGQDDDGIYISKSKIAKSMYSSKSTESVLTFEHYDLDMNLVTSNPIEFKIGKKSAHCIKVFHANDEIKLLIKFKNKKIKKYELYYQTLDKETMQLNDDREKIGSFSYPKKYLRFNTTLSEDKSKVLVVTEIPTKRKETSKYIFNVYDNKFKLLWKKQLVTETKEVFVDNFGNLHYSYPTMMPGKRKNRKVFSGGYTIKSYLNEGKDKKTYLLKYSTRILDKLKVSIDNDKNIVCVGFYRNKDKTPTPGTYFIKIDAESKKITTEKFKLFATKLFTKNMSERSKKRAAKKIKKGKGYGFSLGSFIVRDLVVKDNGGYTLIAELYYVITHTSTNSKGQTTTRYSYHYDDLIVVDIAKDGEIGYMKKIVKKHTTSSYDYFVSYSYKIIGDNVHLIFNDHINNARIKDKGNPRTFSARLKKGNLAMVTIDGEGKITKKVLFSMETSQVFMRANKGESISKNEMIIFGQRKSKQRLAKITFK